MDQCQTRPGKLLTPVLGGLALALERLTSRRPMSVPLQRSKSDLSNVPGKHGLEVLYISLDGMTDPLGRSQVLPYLFGLSKRGHRITLLTLEKPAAFAAESAKVRKLLDEAKIRWVPLRYRESPPILSRSFRYLATSSCPRDSKRFSFVGCWAPSPRRS